MSGRGCQGVWGYLCGACVFFRGICEDFVTRGLTKCVRVCYSLHAKITRPEHIKRHTNHKT
jgi:hypothetical protein